MERRLKRVLAWVLAITLLFSCTNSIGVSTKGESGSIRLYLELPEGTTTADWGVQCRGTDVLVTGGEDFIPAGWETTSVTGLLSGNTGWGYVDVKGAVEGVQFVKKDATVYDCWNPGIAARGLATAYYDPAADEWYEDEAKTIEIQKQKFHVTFKDGDTVITTQEVEYGKDAKAPEVQAKEGYTLSWDMAYTGITADTTVNAVWTANKYTVTFKDGDTVITTQEVEYGKDANAPEVQAKEGYTLSWDKAFTGIKADTTVNAVWTANKYTVTFKDGDTVITTQEVEYGKDAKAPEVQAKEGYTLSWDKAYTGIKADTTVNAVWTANKYTVTFNKNGGSVSKITQTVEYASKYGTLPTAKRKGYTFSGWYTSKKGGQKVTSSVIVSTANTHTLYARWTKVKVGKVSIKSLKPAKKQMVVTFKKVSGVKGYEIVYAANAKFKSAKKLTTTSTKAAIKKLKNISTLYVKVRAYKTDSTGRKVYGSYSSVKTVKIK